MTDDLVYPPRTGDERTILEAYLDWYRDAVVRKTEGLDADALQKRLVPSLTTMYGIVRHLAYVEKWWFQSVLLGRAVDYPWSDDDEDADFRPVPGETAEEMREFYRQACQESRDAYAGVPLDAHAAGEGRDDQLRRIMVHMIEETARHVGHLDILRELTDGGVGN